MREEEFTTKTKPLPPRKVDKETILSVYKNQGLEVFTSSIEVDDADELMFFLTIELDGNLIGRIVLKDKEIGNAFDAIHDALKYQHKLAYKDGLLAASQCIYNKMVSELSKLDADFRGIIALHSQYVSILQLCESADAG